MISGKLIEKLTYLFNVYFQVGYYLKEFKKVNIVMLKKPKKDDYSAPKAYRLIVLLSTLGKALESVVVKRLSNYTKRF